MSYNLFLDDTRHPKAHIEFLRKQNGFGEFYLTEKWYNVTTKRGFIQAITKLGLPIRISFDHDLGCIIHPSEKGLKRKQRKLDTIRPSGMDCAKWLKEYCMDNNITLSAEIKVHSANPTGADNIRGLLYDFQENWQPE